MLFICAPLPDVISVPELAWYDLSLHLADGAVPLSLSGIYIPGILHAYEGTLRGKNISTFHKMEADGWRQWRVQDNRGHNAMTTD